MTTRGDWDWKKKYHDGKDHHKPDPVKNDPPPSDPPPSDDHKTACPPDDGHCTDHHASLISADIGVSALGLEICLDADIGGGLDLGGLDLHDIV